jgi:hypothetical protein
MTDTIEALAKNHTMALPRRLQQLVHALDVLGGELDDAGFEADADRLSKAAGIVEDVRDKFSLLK